MKGRWTTPLILAAVFLPGCATTLKNTPAQERTWAAYDACRGRIPMTTKIDSVDPDGSYRYTIGLGRDGAVELNRCMREEFAKRK